MAKDPFKTRLEIAKSKISKKNLYNKKDNPSPIGTAFKLSTELVSAVAVGTIIGFIFDKTFGTKPGFSTKGLVKNKPNNCPDSHCRNKFCAQFECSSNRRGIILLVIKIFLRNLAFCNL